MLVAEFLTTASHNHLLEVEVRVPGEHSSLISAWMDKTSGYNHTSPFCLFGFFFSVGSDHRMYRKYIQGSHWFLRWKVTLSTDENVQLF